MTTTDFSQCATCGTPTPGNDDTSLLDGWLNLCSTHATEWWAAEDAATEAFISQMVDGRVKLNQMGWL